MNKEKPPVIGDELLESTVERLTWELSLNETQCSHAYQIISDLWNDLEPLIQQAEMKGWRKGNELKQKRLDIKLKMAKAREIFEEIEEEIKTAEAKQIEANNDVENPERYPNERYWQGYEHATRFIGQSIKSKYMEGR